MVSEVLTQKELKKSLLYEKDTGKFIWRVKKARGVKVGDIAGCTDHHGYVKIKVDGRLYAAHRLSFLYVTGKFPVENVDHINRVTDDNRWINLRECTQSQNGANRKPHKNNTTGYKGVSFNKSVKKFVAYITFKNKRKHIGFFECKHEAAEAYNKEAIKMHGKFATLNHPADLMFKEIEG